MALIFDPCTEISLKIVSSLMCHFEIANSRYYSTPRVLQREPSGQKGKDTLPRMSC